MKLNTLKILPAFYVSAYLLFSSCSKKENNPEPAIVYFEQHDQMGRPGINTVFVTPADKDLFNITIPSDMSTKFQAKFQAQLDTVLNPNYTTNALMLNSTQFTSLIVTDVLNVSTTGPTTFFDGIAANTLSGRKLEDDVIDVELLLIFGGPSGMSNPTLIKDNVNANDKVFLTTFPYLAEPF